jgi:anti-sigma factor RsiW
MSLCQSIDTLAMAYLDDELVSEERRELELHLLSCAACKAHVETERAEIALVRKALAPPPAPAAMKVSIQRLLDAEDRAAARAARQRWTRFVLPGSAALAAAAALAVFVFAQPGRDAPAVSGTVAREAVRVQSRKMPLEVQGPSTGQWLRQNFAANVEPPRFTEPGIELVGARLTAVAGHDAALLKYLVTMGARQFTLTAVVIDDMRGDELSGGTAVRLGGNGRLHLHSADGTPAVTYVDESAPMGARIGYAFASDGLKPDELVELVVSSDLIRRAQQGR